MACNLTREHNGIGTFFNLSFVRSFSQQQKPEPTKLLPQPKRMKADTGEVKVAAIATLRILKSIVKCSSGTDGTDPGKEYICTIEKNEYFQLSKPCPAAITDAD
jgi:hypothetical protein